MKQSVNFSQFCDAFKSYGRGDNFDYEGLQVLFDYLENLYDEIGQEYELDVIALCCEYSQDEVDYIASQYDIDVSECEDDEAKSEVVQDYLRDHSQVCGVCVNGSIVYQQF